VSPGYHAAVITACHAAGFEPELDDTSTGSTAWNNIAAGRGVALVIASAAPQVRGGIALVKLGSPPAHIILDALWRRDNEPPTDSGSSTPRAASAPNTPGSREPCSALLTDSSHAQAAPPTGLPNEVSTWTVH